MIVLKILSQFVSFVQISPYQKIPEMLCLFHYYNADWKLQIMVYRLSRETRVL